MHTDINLSNEIMIRFLAVSKYYLFKRVLQFEIIHSCKKIQ